MRIKKLLGLLIVMAFVLAFAVPASAGCHNCKCPLWYIDCGTEGSAQGGDDCNYFDFETSYEYCPSTDYPGGATAWSNRDCKLVFDICQCEDASTNFDSTDTIGIRMTILVDGEEGDNGVYWTNWSNIHSGTSNNVELSTYRSLDSACDDDGGGGADGLFGTVAYYLDKATPPTAGVALTPGVADDSCEVPAINKVWMLSSVTDQGYEVTAADELDQRHMWWIDVPAMHYDYATVTSGGTVSVLVELLSEGSGGICAECDAICECTMEIGIMCCPQTVYSYCMYFPYVLTGSDPWSTGIVITNLSSVAIANMTATFTLTDSTGTAFTYDMEAGDFDSKVWSNTLDAILPEFEGTGTPAAGNAWLKITTNFAVDGYSFITNGSFGAGTLPRGICDNCPCN